MEAKHNSPVKGRAALYPAVAELVIQNGRHKGSSRPLNLPLTTIGRSPGCDLRLNVEGIGPLHCCLAYGPAGLYLRQLHEDGDTLVNGQPAGSEPLQHGDLLAVGPFQFQLRLQGPSPAQQLSDAHARQQTEKEALRIQAAAVAAQQAALTEEEARLQERRAALEQQEAQLGQHLAEKQAKLNELRDQARAEHAALKAERAAHETQVSADRRELEAARNELAEAKRQSETERQRLSKLLQGLKRRYERQWADERAALQKREAETIRERRDVEHEREKLQRERGELLQARLRFNGEVELGRRQLHADWETFRQEQDEQQQRWDREHDDLRERSRALNERQQTLAAGERELEADKRDWQQHRLQLEREADGLENRVRNLRRKLGEMEREVAGLETQKVSLENQRSAAEAPVAETPAEVCPEAVEDVAAAALCDFEATLGETAPPAVEPPPPPVTAPPSEPVAAVVLPQSAAEADAEALRQLTAERLAQLETLAGELADQRLHLAEQYQRLVNAREAWRAEHEAATSAVEEAAHRLHAREGAIRQRERALETTERHQAQLENQAAALQRHLEGWQSRMTARETSWSAERDRLLADVQSREQLAEQRLTAVGQLHERWQRRRRKEVQWVQTERAAAAKARKEFTTLRQRWLERHGELDREQRSLAERALAIEQFQQECIGKAAHPAAAARRLERLRQRWANLAAAAQKSLNQEREALEQEGKELEEYHGRLAKQADHISSKEAELGEKLADWEKAQLAAHEDMNRLRADMHLATVCRDRYEMQVNDLRDEVERLARLLLDEVEPVVLSAGKAAA
ncbi:MAG: FHA domain-containing protein [Planctomycetia bacterium]|nr:FHA domain-containing protein [Planctomycetia bacterium]